MAMKAGDASSSMEILALFDEAIRVDPTSPVLYLNKASFLLQVCSCFVTPSWPSAEYLLVNLAPVFGRPFCLVS